MLNKTVKYDMLREKFFSDGLDAGLNSNQKHFFEEFFKRENTLLTGPAGTGKSFVTKILFDFLDSQKIPVGKTALTGIAAINIGGSTLHSWCGIGLAEEDVKYLTKKVSKNKNARSRICAAEVLIVDEVSMASGELLNKLDAILRHCRLNEDPFGGIQMLFVGDFLQLPPIFKKGKGKDFAFHSNIWKEAGVKKIILEDLVRQDKTTDFAKILNKIRVGDIKDLGILKSRINAKLDSGNITPVRIFCKNVDVFDFNDRKLKEIKSESKMYYASDSGDQKYLDSLNRVCLAPSDLELRVGAQVMLLYNLDVESGLVNGSVGVVKEMHDDKVEVTFENDRVEMIEPQKWEIKEQSVKTVDGKEEFVYRVVASRKQIPLRLAWASTVHKTQGQTIPFAEIDLSEAFEDGQAYVALSRVKSLEGLSLKPFSLDRIRTNRDCVNFYKDLSNEEHEEFL